MIIRSKHILARIARQLKNGTAKIVGKTCSGHRWPEGEHYYVIEDYMLQCTHHIPVVLRRTWERK